MSGDYFSRITSCEFEASGVVSSEYSLKDKLAHPFCDSAYFANTIVREKKARTGPNYIPRAVSLSVLRRVVNTGPFWDA